MIKITASAALMSLMLAPAAFAGPAADATAKTPVSLAQCMDTATHTVGSKITHVEFESRDGVPTYEFVLEGADDNYYVACSGLTGLLSHVDVVVKEGDARWTAVAKIKEDEAKSKATALYKGEVEEVKRLLLSSGEAVYEVDVEVKGGDGEFNVYVDAATGKVKTVNVEYWELGETVPGDKD